MHISCLVMASLFRWMLVVLDVDILHMACESVGSYVFM